MSAWGGRGNVDISDVCINNVVAQKTAYPAKLYAQNAKFERIFISNYQSECRGAIIAEVGSGEITDLTFSNITIYDIEPQIKFPQWAQRDRGPSIFKAIGVKHFTCDNVCLNLRDKYFEDRNIVCMVENVDFVKSDISYVYKSKLERTNF